MKDMQKVYNTYAGVYDFVFGKVFHPGRVLSTNLINQQAAAGMRILEAGVGTGLSLPMYRSDLNIVGIDISEKMLKKAEKLVTEENLSSHVSLKKMDVSNLAFPNDSFDFVAAMYVASVVSDLTGFLNEITRVCKPNGHVIIVNHFASNNPLIKKIEKTITGVYPIVGFKTDLSVNAILDYHGMKLIKTYKTNLFGYWKLLHLQKYSPAS